MEYYSLKITYPICCVHFKKKHNIDISISLNILHTISMTFFNLKCHSHNQLSLKVF